MSDARNNPKPQIAYGTYNFGNLVSIHRLRRDAIEEIIRDTGRPWDEARKFMEVHKVVVQKFGRKNKADR